LRSTKKPPTVRTPLRLPGRRLLPIAILNGLLFGAPALHAAKSEGSVDAPVRI
jgi:hypothetical protein